MHNFPIHVTLTFNQEFDFLPLCLPFYLLPVCVCLSWNFPLSAHLPVHLSTCVQDTEHTLKEQSTHTHTHTHTHISTQRTKSHTCTHTHTHTQTLVCLEGRSGCVLGRWLAGVTQHQVTHLALFSLCQPDGTCQPPKNNHADRHTEKHQNMEINWRCCRNTDSTHTHTHLDPLIDTKHTDSMCYFSVCLMCLQTAASFKTDHLQLFYLS